ncbi:hypothetical protein BBG19_0078 [Francisella sp. MA067296]|nr:hypothetical protein BBG19_0078 [Francisella sp. MA067296]
MFYIIKALLFSSITQKLCPVIIVKSGNLVCAIYSKKPL